MPAETQTIADYVARARLSDLPDAVRHEGVRAFLNWLGCTLGGCRHEIVETVDCTLGEFSGPADSTVIGRQHRYDMFLASCLNCMSSSVYTFDDTHAEAIVHPTGPVASAVFALAERHGNSGADDVRKLQRRVRGRPRHVVPYVSRIERMRREMRSQAGCLN